MFASPLSTFLHCALAAVQCIVIGPVCGWVCLCVCRSVTTITRNCMHRSSPKTGFVGKGDHLQLIKFWLSCAPGRGSAVGWKFLAPPYYSQRAVFASPLSAFFHSLYDVMCSFHLSESELVEWAGRAVSGFLYRASATACNACRARCCFYQFVCLSVQLYLKGWTYCHTFWHSDRGVILVFLAPALLQSSKRGLKYKRVGNFRKYCPSSRKRYEIWAVVTMDD